MKMARHRKALTLAIVDATLSGVVKPSDRTLCFVSNSPPLVARIPGS